MTTGGQATPPPPRQVRAGQALVASGVADRGFERTRSLAGRYDPALRRREGYVTDKTSCGGVIHRTLPCGVRYCGMAASGAGWLTFMALS